jgi:hypothetical protein
MKLTHRLHPLKLRHKFAALGVVAVAMVATPLVQVLRYQSAEIQAALYEQAGLDPVSGAVTLQHALLAHRDIAGLVLRGVQQLEPERTLRQAEVDDRAATLETTLFTLRLPRAVGEAQALRQDWVTLVPQVEQRKINATDSDAAHRLLVEQTLQVIDLVAAASGLDSHGPAKTYLASVRELTALPHVTAQIAALGLPADSGAERGDVAAAEAALARALGHLSEGLNRGALNNALLAGAVASAGVSADRLFQLRRQADPADAAALAAATATALQAQARLFDAASHTVRTALVARVDRVKQQRANLLVLVAALAVLALGLARAVQGHLAPLHPDDPNPQGAGFDGERDGQTLHRDVAGRLWQRLRQDGAQEGTPAAPPAAAPAAAPTALHDATKPARTGTGTPIDQPDKDETP